MDWITHVSIIPEKHKMPAEPRMGLLLLLFAALAAGCGTTSPHSAPDVDPGDASALTEHYLLVLEADPDDRRTRNRLFDAGNRAVANLLAEADAAAKTGDTASETDAFFSIDGLRARAAVAGVSLQLPVDYPERRRAAFDRKIAELLSRGDDAAAARQWQDALRSYERISALEPDEDTAAFLLSARSALFLDWAENALEAEEYRAAHQLVLQAADHAPDSLFAERAELLRLMVEDQGKKRVALIPLHFLDARSNEAGIYPALAEILTVLFEQHSEPFIEPVDPGAVWRETRRLRRDAESLSGENLLEVGAALDADVLAILQPGEEGESVEIHLFHVAEASIIDRGLLVVPGTAAPEFTWHERPSSTEIPLPAASGSHAGDSLLLAADLLLDRLFSRIGTLIE